MRIFLHYLINYLSIKTPLVAAEETPSLYSRSFTSCTNDQYVSVTCSQSFLLNPAPDCKTPEGREYLILLIGMAPDIQNPRIKISEMKS